MSLVLKQLDQTTLFRKDLGKADLLCHILSATPVFLGVIKHYQAWLPATGLLFNFHHINKTLPDDLLHLM